MKKILKASICFILVLSALLSLCSCGIIGKLADEQNQADFYDLCYETKGLLDKVADDIYNNWYDCIYKDDFNGDIDKAIDAAYDDNADRVETIIANTEEINSLYKEIKDTEMEYEAKELMRAYNDYYTLIIEVSGSFNTFSAAKEPASQALDTALRNFYTEF